MAKSVRKRLSMESSTEHAPAKRVLNGRLLLITVALMGSICTLGYLWYCHQNRQIAEVLKARATALEGERWSEAAFYYRRHLQLAPDDVDVRIKLINVLEQSRPNCYSTSAYHFCSVPDT